MKPAESMRGSVNRREFLKTSALALGGLTVSVTLPSGLLRAAGEGGASGFAPNAFVHVASDGAVTIWCGRCEMGQGISTALPAAVADELEADWAQVTVLQGDADKKYGPQGTGGYWNFVDEELVLVDVGTLDAKILKRNPNLKNIKVPMLLPGIHLHTSPADFAPIEAIQLGRFDGKRYVEFGDVLGQ